VAAGLELSVMQQSQHALQKQSNSFKKLPEQRLASLKLAWSIAVAQIVVIALVVIFKCGDSYPMKAWRRGHGVADDCAPCTCDSEGFLTSCAVPALIVPNALYLRERGIKGVRAGVFEVEGFEAMTILDLAFNEGMEDVSSVPKAVTHLDLQQAWGLGDDASVSLARALRGVDELKSLYLNGNQFTTAGAKEMAGILARQSKLRHIDFGHNPIGPEGVAALVGALREGHPHIETMELIGVDMQYNGTVELADCLVGKSRLRVLSIGKTSMNVMAAEALSERLAHMPMLKVLNMGFNPITGKGTDAVATALGRSGAQLEYLSMGACEIGDIGVSALARVIANTTKLVEVHLFHNFISPNGILALCKALEAHDELRTFDISSNYGDSSNYEAQAHAALAGMLQSKYKLQQLKLASVFPQADAVALANSLADKDGLVYVDVTSMRLNEESAFAFADALASKTDLTTAIFSKNWPMGDEGSISIARAVRTSPNLVDLEMIGNKLTPEAEAQIQELVPFVVFEDQRHVHNECPSLCPSGSLVYPELFHSLAGHDDMTCIEREKMHATPSDW
jgi:Ran GTPase-activating protein (RanGAP) involved in mRNA processing and transport